MERSEHQTRLDRALVAAYRATRYRVLAPMPFRLEVDRRSAALDALMRSVDVRGAAFITAWNPRGEPHADDLNRQRQEALRDTLRQRGLPFVEGFGAHAGDESQGEESLLVLGLDRLAACALGEGLGQNAILWSGRDAVPRLILLR
jgi:hypothetical protein